MYPTSPGATSGRSATQSANLAAVRRNSSAEVEETGKISCDPSGDSTAGAVDDSTGGACSTTAWTLEPDIPYADTPARRGPCALPGHGITVCGTKRFVLTGASLSGIPVKCRFGGTTPCSTARTIFIRPSAPAADMVCPKLVFTDPTAQGPSTPYTCARPVYSMGSPTGVPVPWASISPTVSASTPATASAVRHAAACASEDGVD
ncbi:Uncharacterised protein [Mycobacteroides abscessus subsp. abscessus]|nr:Uncharacterised protein [Mycobacteroides abscessus subsp. abscessus]